MVYYILQKKNGFDIKKARKCLLSRLALFIALKTVSSHGQLDFQTYRSWICIFGGMLKNENYEFESPANVLRLRERVIPKYSLK